MLTENQILTVLDNTHQNGIQSFVQLGHAYSYLLDCRLNLFKGENDKWAIVIERLGYNPRAGSILLEVFYYGNCLSNLDEQDSEQSGNNTFQLIDWDNFIETTDGEVLKPDASYWLVGGQKVPLSHDKLEYLQAGIELKEYEPDTISIEEVGRLLMTKHGDLFRATDEELYKSIPTDMQKLLVLDEWYHRDYFQLLHQDFSEEEIRNTYEFNRDLYNSTLRTDAPAFIDFDSFATNLRRSVAGQNEHNKQQWEENRPSVYETWQQVAKVLATGDVTYYKPTLEPNTHWKYWPESGSL